MDGLRDVDTARGASSQNLNMYTSLGGVLLLLLHFERTD